jgi:NhaA family Na+:H+ antiporter
MALSTIKDFLRLEAAAGILLLAAAVLAIVLSNSPASGLYATFLEMRVAVTVNGTGLTKPLLLWINEGLMAIFFLLVSLEIKREFIEGELSTRQKATLPAIAALGGMIAPALVYWGINHDQPDLLRGWAIPTATDIAFAVGVLSVLGTRAPGSLKILLLALAIIDDLGAIVIIAVFYTEDLSLVSLTLGGIGIGTLAVLNRAGVSRVAPYAMVGIVLWLCVVKSGVHATMVGVALGLTIPLRTHGNDGHSPLRHLEEVLHPWVSYAILPLFAFANAGVLLRGMSLSSLFEPLPLGIGAGLFVGKQLGVMAATWIAMRSKLAVLPDDVSWLQYYGMALLTGIGFTMSLFIGTLAFDHSDYAASVRIGVLGGSMLSALAGALVLWLAPARTVNDRNVDAEHSTRVRV